MGILTDDMTTGDVLNKMPKRLMERDIRRLTAKRVAGEALTAEEELSLSQHQSYQAQVGEPTAMEVTGVPGFARSAKAAYDDPSIANLTTAGAHGAALAMRPAAALGLLATGYADAARKDVGGLLGTAQAEDNGLTESQKKRLKALEAKSQLSRAEREEKNAIVGIQSQFLAEQAKARFGVEAKEKTLAAEQAAREKEANRAEYDRSVKTAETVRDRIQSTDKSFKDSNVGQYYEKSGGLTPMIAGLGAGMIGRAAHGSGGSKLASIGMPAAEGTGAAFATMNAPLVYDAFSTPTMNPQRQALEAYSRELPPEHPRKAEYAGYAEKMPEINPVQKAARDELFSPMGNVRRLGASVIEGGLAGVTGGNMLPAARRGLEAVGEVPGTVAAGFHKGMTRATERATDRAKQGGLLSVANEDALASVDRARSSRVQAAPAPEAAPSGGLLTRQEPMPMPQPQAAAPQLVPPASARWNGDTVQNAVNQFIAANPDKPMAALQPAALKRMIEAQLPPGSSGPTLAEAQQILAQLRSGPGTAGLLSAAR